MSLIVWYLYICGNEIHFVRRLDQALNSIDSYLKFKCLNQTKVVVAHQVCKYYVFLLHKHDIANIMIMYEVLILKIIDNESLQIWPVHPINRCVY